VIGAARRGAIVAAAALWLAACAQVARVEPEAPPAADGSFAAAGRLSAHRGQDVLIANFDWKHRVDSDAIVLATPLGQTLATLDRLGGTAAIRLADGRYREASSFEALTKDAFGMALPVSGLASWMRATPREGSAFTIERDAGGRPQSLRQDGWTIDFGYADASARRPRLLTLAYADIAMRIVVDRWQ
jgi:outer membrane lipoprotein LolB